VWQCRYIQCNREANGVLRAHEKKLNLAVPFIGGNVPFAAQEEDIWRSKGGMDVEDLLDEKHICSRGIFKHTLRPARKAWRRWSMRVGGRRANGCACLLDCCFLLCSHSSRRPRARMSTITRYDRALFLLHMRCKRTTTGSLAAIYRSTSQARL
jgi:hypothetical protein